MKEDTEELELLEIWTLICKERLKGQCDLIQPRKAKIGENKVEELCSIESKTNTNVLKQQLLVTSKFHQEQ